LFVKNNLVGSLMEHYRSTMTNNKITIVMHQIHIKQNIAKD